MAASTAFPLTKKVQENFINYYRKMQDNLDTVRQHSRDKYTIIDKQYQREMDRTEEHKRAQAANRYGDTSRYQNSTVPVVAPQVEAAVTYQTSVFLTGAPIFGVVASPKFMDEAMQLETALENHADRGGWTRELILFFRDGFKYNFSAVEVSWAQEITYDLSTDLAFSKSEAKPEKIIWSGNKLRRLDPYNTFVDSRVDPTRAHIDGEFSGYTEIMSRTKLKTFISELPDKLVGNIKAALESGNTYSTAPSAESRGYYIPRVREETNPKEDGINWLNWASLTPNKEGAAIDYRDVYEVTTLYCRIIPDNFELRIAAPNTPQIFKLVIINHEHVIYCERQTNAHNLLPILIGQPMEDGLAYQTKSLATNATPFQEVASAYMNSIMHSRRRAVTDRVLYDPSRITSANINSENASAKIPVRPAAYGKTISDAVYQFPYRQDQNGNDMQQIQTLLGLANSLAGQNQASQGQFVKGNKTLHEFESVMQNANGRDQLAAILLEAQVFQPMKLILKTNILQYQGGISLFNKERRRQVDIDPIKLRKAVLEFKVSDGLIPSSKIISGDSLAVALQTIGSSPQIASGYNIAPLFSYLMKSQGAAIADFEKSKEQIAYEQAVNSWQQTVLQALKDNPALTQEQLPPQPSPDQYGYNPQEDV